MKNLNYLLLACLLILSNSLFSQNHSCGISHDAQLYNANRIIENRRNANPISENARVTTTFVPITFHLVADSNGEFRADKKAVLDALCILNEVFQGDTDPIQFYLHEDGFNYIDNSNLLNDPTSIGAYDKMQEEKKDHSINIFIVESIPTGGGINSLTYYQPPTGVADWIVITSSYLYAENGLSHSVGHFFSLIHPFFGWESGSWMEGVPVDSLCPNTTYPTENQSGSNCTIAGDMICDTPPDYLFAFSSTTQACDFTGNAIDFEGNQVNPLENNVMSLFHSCTEYDFTVDQYDVMILDLGTTARDYVNPGTTPFMDPITEEVELISPSQGEVTAYNEILFEWEPVSGATQYLLEIDRLPSFGFDKQCHIVSGTSIIITDLEPERIYYWRVRPFNQYITCPGFSPIEDFETGGFVNTSEPEWISYFSLSPNPVAQKQSLFLNIQSSKAFQGEINIYSISGKKVYTQVESYTAGQTSSELRTDNLPIGVYTISIITADGVLNRKIVIQ